MNLPENLIYSWVKDPLEIFQNIGQSLVDSQFLIRSDLKCLLSPDFLGVDELGLIAVPNLTDLVTFEVFLPVNCVRRILAWLESPASEIIHPNFVGYDVFDLKCFISGLSNCQYNQNELENLRKEYGSDINEYGLFSSLEKAYQFTDRIANQRALEHQPFYVIGIFYFDEPSVSYLLPPKLPS